LKQSAQEKIVDKGARRRVGLFENSEKKTVWQGSACGNVSAPG
jgi:hypothetical protein